MNLEKQIVLVVDDIYFNAKYIEDILKSDYMVVIVTSGKECLEYVEHKKVDLILLDIVMPEMDGYEVCQKLKSNAATKKIPVVFLSIKGEIEDEIRGLELGAIDYIIKPACASIIKARIKNHLALKKYNDLLEKLSYIDELTGLFNRRYLDEVLKKEWRCALRTGEILSVLLIDIDFFKDYNDCYGHLAGDVCLQKVATVLKNSVIRSSDIVTRYGGEEFIIILPATSQNGAINVAKRLQAQLALLQIVHQGSDVSEYVTLSVGSASAIAKDFINEKGILEMADFALYQAKNQGRNRIV
ncbi:MAG: diguanylate cyclase response regulator [Firmicutes bacterium]|nr:diguanylate cyclase response regulator [Bacillota bacterium]